MGEKDAEEVHRTVGQPVRTPKMAELIGDSLRRRIVRGELKAGDALPSEAALMDQFGVSRPTLREAFRVLESEALITIRRGAHGGARVTSPDGALAARYAGLVLEYRGTTLRDLFEARSQIEPQAAAMAAMRCAESSIAELRDLYDQISDTDKVLERITLHTLFDAALVRASGNQTMILMSSIVRSIIDRVTVESVMESAHRKFARDAYHDAHKAHARLITLIERGDARWAAAHWKRHLDLAQQFVLSTGISGKTVLDLLVPDLPAAWMRPS